MSGPPAVFVRAGIGFFSFVNSWKWKKIVREFVKTILFVIRERWKYRSRICENGNICSWIREFWYIRDSWFDKITFSKWWNPQFLSLRTIYIVDSSPEGAERYRKPAHIFFYFYFLSRGAGIRKAGGGLAHIDDDLSSFCLLSTVTLLSPLQRANFSMVANEVRI